MNRHTLVSMLTTYRAGASWPGLLGLRRTLVRLLLGWQQARRARDRRLPAPTLQFGLQVDGRPVRGTRWGLGPPVYLAPDATGHRTGSARLIRSLLAAGYAVIALEGRTDHAGLDRVLAAVAKRHGPATAVIKPSDRDAGSTVADLLAGRRTRP